MRRAKKWMMVIVLFVILLSALFITFWAVQFHIVAVHAQAEISKENHLPLTSIKIVGVQLLGTHSYLNLFGVKFWNITYHISGLYYPPNTANSLSVTQFPGGKFEYYQINL